MYPSFDIRLSKLKGQDYCRAYCAAVACSKAGDFCVLLASMEKVVSYPNDEDCDRTEIELEVQVRDLQGFLLSEPLAMSEDLILNPPSYDKIRQGRDEKSGGEYWGNQHAEMVEVYNDIVSNETCASSVTCSLLDR